MIEMPVFKEENWYLDSVKSLLVDNRIKDDEKRIDNCNKKIRDISKSLNEIICDEDFSIPNKQITLFEQVILAPYKDLKRIHDRIDKDAENIFYDHIEQENGKTKRVIKRKWNAIYSLYDKFIKKGLNIKLIQKYGVKCCPYCNENYIINRYKNGSQSYAMGQLDHFYPRDKFPVFSMSLYNLIPSCGSCNHIKASNEITISPHDHARKFSNLRISYVPKSSRWIDDADEIDVLFCYDESDVDFKNGMEKNLEVMGIKSSYNVHRDYIQEILKKAQIYGQEARSNLLNDFPELFVSDDELIKVIFSNYIDEKDSLKRPLSKLTQDILKELNII